MNEKAIQWGYNNLFWATRGYEWGYRVIAHPNGIASAEDALSLRTTMFSWLASTAAEGSPPFTFKEPGSQDAWWVVGAVVIDNEFVDKAGRPIAHEIALRLRKDCIENVSELTGQWHLLVWGLIRPFYESIYRASPKELPVLVSNTLNVEGPLPLDKSTRRSDWLPVDSSPPKKPPAPGKLPPKWRTFFGICFGALIGATAVAISDRNRVDLVFEGSDARGTALGTLKASTSGIAWYPFGQDKCYQSDWTEFSKIASDNFKHDPARLEKQQR